MTKCHCPKPQYKKCLPKPLNPNPQTHKSVAFHKLAFCPWHSDRIPIVTYTYAYNHNPKPKAPYKDAMAYYQLMLVSTIHKSQFHVKFGAVFPPSCRTLDLSSHASVTFCPCIIQKWGVENLGGQNQWSLTASMSYVHKYSGDSMYLLETLQVR